MANNIILPLQQQSIAALLHLLLKTSTKIQRIRVLHPQEHINTATY